LYLVSCVRTWKQLIHNAFLILSIIGDTLFLGGCGRFFEGNATQMYEALIKILSQLPDSTAVFCGHEYAIQNLKFGLHVEPSNQDILSKLADIETKRKTMEPSVPSTIGKKKFIVFYLENYRI